MTSERRETWDLYCRVVDNYGDVGIAWRLARQLAAGPARSVRLIVEGLDVLARIEPRLDPARDASDLEGIRIERWPGSASASGADVMVDVLGCGLPRHALEAMAIAGTPPVWIDFEHLSAESWVEGFHRMPSPHPVLPLIKHFFYPGFDAQTGGLWIEPDLDRRRRDFVGSPQAQAALWRDLAMAPPQAGELRVSLFAYADAPVDALLHALAADAAGPMSVVVPEGVLSSSIDRFFGARGVRRTRGPLSVTSIPFVDQDRYDRLLWSCDINFVRGEDSFVRAQAAARPFVWQIYRQSEDAHLKKLAAFADRYEAGLPPAVAQAHRTLWDAWNGSGAALQPAWAAWRAALPAIAAHAVAWQARLARETPLVDRLVAFAAGLGAPAQPRVDR